MEEGEGLGTRLHLATMVCAKLAIFDRHVHDACAQCSILYIMPVAGWRF